MLAPTDDKSTEVDEVKLYRTCVIQGIRQLKEQTHLAKIKKDFPPVFEAHT